MGSDTFGARGRISVLCERNFKVAYELSEAQLA